MEPIASIQSSQKHTACPSPQPHKSSPLPPYFLMINFKIILPSTSRPLTLLQSFRFHHQNSVCISLLPHTRYMPCPPHAPWCDPIIAFGAESKSRRSLFCNVLQSPATFSLLCQNTLLGTPLPEYPHPAFFPGDEISHPYKTTGKIMVLYISLFKRRIESNLPFDGIIRSSPYNPR
jgi:hypothetical protein